MGAEVSSLHLGGYCCGNAIILVGVLVVKVMLLERPRDPRQVTAAMASWSSSTVARCYGEGELFRFFIIFLAWVGR